MYGLGFEFSLTLENLCVSIFIDLTTPPVTTDQTNKPQD